MTLELEPIRVKSQWRGPLHWAWSTHRGKQRPENQDYAKCFVTPEGEVWLLLADGMGGTEGGRVASMMAVEALHLHVYNTTREKSKGKQYQRLLDGFEKARKALVTEGKRTPSRSEMATTLMVACAYDQDFLYMHTGDTRLYYLRNGELFLQSTDQTLGAEWVKEGRCTKEEVERTPVLNWIEHGVSAFPEETVAVLPPLKEKDGTFPAFFRLQPGDKILLSTDGLYREVEEATFLAMLQDMHPVSFVRQATKEALRQGGRDNIGLIALSVQKEEPDELGF